MVCNDFHSYLDWIESRIFQSYKQEMSLFCDLSTVQAFNNNDKSSVSTLNFQTKTIILPFISIPVTGYVVSWFSYLIYTIDCNSNNFCNYLTMTYNDWYMCYGCKTCYWKEGLPVGYVDFCILALALTHGKIYPSKKRSRPLQKVVVIKLLRFGKERQRFFVGRETNYSFN